MVAVLHIGSEQLKLQLVPLVGARNTDLTAARFGICPRASAHSFELEIMEEEGKWKEEVASAGQQQCAPLLKRKIT